MGAVDVVAALVSALLHAGWNAAVKASRNPAQAMTAQMLLSALLVLPGLWWTGLPNAAAWPWIAASTLMNVVTVSALLRAYELVGFGIAYPVGRAVAVLLVVPLAALVAGDQPGLAALGGVVVIALALSVLGFDAARDRGISRQAIAWTLAAGLGTAAYIICDARGVRAAGSPWAYGFVVSITNALAMCWRRRRDGPPWRQLAGAGRIGLPGAIASAAPDPLILCGWAHAP